MVLQQHNFCFFLSFFTSVRTYSTTNDYKPHKIFIKCSGLKVLLSIFFGFFLFLSTFCSRSPKSTIVFLSKSHEWFGYIGWNWSSLLFALRVPGLLVKCEKFCHQSNNHQSFHVPSISLLFSSLTLTLRRLVEWNFVDFII